MSFNFTIFIGVDFWTSPYENGTVDFMTSPQEYTGVVRHLQHKRIPFKVKTFLTYISTYLESVTKNMTQSPKCVMY